MNVRNLVLAGALLAFTTLTADAQGRRGGGGRGYSSYNSGRNFYPGANNFNSGYGGVPYYSNGYNNFNRGTGFGIGLGALSPFSYGQSYSYGSPSYGQSYYYSTPSYGQTYYSTPSTGQTYYYSTPTVVTPQSTIQPTTYTEQTSATTTGEMGLRITTLNEGTAKSAGLRAGDIIMKVNNQRTQNFETLRNVLSTSGKSKVDIEFIDSSNNTLQTRSVGVENTKIGVTVEEVPVDRK